MTLIPEHLVKPADTKIVLVVADGLGGIPLEAGGPTELEAAHTPNLDHLAADGALGLGDPVGAGITPGSGQGHLALFGFEPLETSVGRGLLSALGNDFDLREGDVAARGDFCSLDADGNVTDRRAGRIPTDQSAPLCSLLEEKVDLGGQVEVFVRPIKDHRFLLVLRGPHLSDQVEDTDAQRSGVPPLKCKPLREEAARTARLVDEFTLQAKRILAESGQDRATGVLLRGFSRRLPLQSFADRYGLHAAALADYPMYRGIARLAGMEVISDSADLETRFKVVQERWKDFDFFFIHYKDTDTAGENGDFDGKVKAIEELDRALPTLLEVDPDVLIVTGDHSTPAAMGTHSWHPVPVLFHGRNVRIDSATSFGETSALLGSLGRFPMTHLMPLALAHAGRLLRYGA